MRIKYIGPPDHAPAGGTIWEPDEERDVPGDEAARLLRNVWFVEADGLISPGPLPKKSAKDEGAPDAAPDTAVQEGAN